MESVSSRLQEIWQSKQAPSARSPVILRITTTLRVVGSHDRGRKSSVANMAGPRFLCSQTKLTFFGRPFRGPVNLISSVGIPRLRHSQPDSQAAKPPYLVPTFGGLPIGEVWC